MSAHNRLMEFIERSFPGDHWRHMFVIRWSSIPKGISEIDVSAMINQWCIDRFHGTITGTRFQSWSTPQPGAFAFRTVEQAMEFKLTWVGYQFDDNK